MKLSIISSGAFSALLLLAGQAEAHSWVEELRRITPNGSFLNTPGYARSFRQRGQGNVDENMSKNLAPTGAICNPVLGPVVKTDSNAKFPRLKVAAGDAIALRYLENGHVTLPPKTSIKPDNKGTVYIYGTTKPKENARLEDVHRKWTADGKGGDKTGVLLAKRPYDDGRCFEAGNPTATARMNQLKMTAADPLQGASAWCQNDVELPKDLKPGETMTLYWIWDYSSIDKPAPDSDNLKGAKVVTSEFYSSCIDLAVVSDCDASLGNVKGPKCANPKRADFKFTATNLKDAAIPDQLPKPGNVKQEIKEPEKGNADSKKEEGKKEEGKKEEGKKEGAKNNAQHTTFITVTKTEARTTVTVQATPTAGGKDAKVTPEGGAPVAPAPAPAAPTPAAGAPAAPVPAAAAAPPPAPAPSSNPAEAKPKDGAPAAAAPAPAPATANTGRPEVVNFVRVRRGQNWFGSD